MTRLEAIRGFAAMYVMVSHAHLSDRPEIKWLLSFGQEAVILFFILSGFVIQYASHRGGTLIDFGKYFYHRARRIYPTFLIALATAYIASSLCDGTWRGIRIPQLAGNLMMLQDMPSLKRGVWVGTYAGNSPLWSLSYESWFYMMFYPIVSGSWISPEHKRSVVFLLSITGFISYQAWPNQVSLFLGYFFIWWVGVELAREYLTSRTITWSCQRPAVLMVACLASLWAVPVVFAVAAARHLRLGVDPVLQFRHFGGALLFVVVGIGWNRIRFIGFKWLLGPFALLAPVSYALYALHVPVLQFVSAHIEVNRIAQLALATAILLPICYLVEVVAQRRINSWLDRLLKIRVISPLSGAKHVITNV